MSAGLPSWKRSCKKPPRVEAITPAAPAAPLPLPPEGGCLAVPVRGQQFPLSTVRLFVRAVLELPASLRGAAGLFKLLWEEGLSRVDDRDGPSAACGRLWLLRVGLYELVRPKQCADDWIWIVDHTIQLGTTRVLLVVGLRRGVWEAQGRGALAHQDLQVLLLEPVRKSNAEVVCSQLEKVAAASGAPRAILSDQCRELNQAVEQFQAAHPRSLRRNDLKHRLALLLERRLKSEAPWGEFLRDLPTMRKQSRQTALAFLSPPATKEKARFMNLGELVRWASATRTFLDRPTMPPGVTLDLERLESVFGALRKYDAALSQWQALIDLIDAAMAWVRQDGYSRGGEVALRGVLTPWACQEQTRPFVEEVLSFVQQQTAGLESGEHLPGTSEVIESLFGKGKRLEGQQSKAGFTRMVLGLAAAVAKPTGEQLQQALETIRTKHVACWAQSHLGPSLQSLRRQTLGRIRAEQIQDKTQTPARPTF